MTTGLTSLGAASVRYGLWHRALGSWIHASAPAISSPAAATTADAAVRASSTPADAATPIASGNVPSIPTPVSVDDWVPVPPSKARATKTRHAQMPH